MKKLLVILTLALALCLVFSIASAEVKYGTGYTVNVTGDTATITADATITVDGKTYNVVGVDVNYSGSFPATLTVNRTPENCGKKVDVFVKYDYDASKTIIKAEWMQIFDHVLPAKPETVITEPTCTEDGKGIFKCTKCSELVEAKIAKLGHDLVEYITKEPTCNEDGTAEKRCSRCDYISPEYALKGTHVWEQIFVAPQCEKGKKMTDWEGTGYSYWKCSTCGHVAQNVVENTDKTFTVTNEKAALDDSVKTKYATLTAFNAAAPATAQTDGHDWSTWRYEEATCVAPGYKVRWCYRCESNETKAIEATDPLEYQDDITKKDVNWDVALRDDYLACSFDPAKDYGKGKAAYVYCTVCGGKYHAFAKVGDTITVNETTTFGTAPTAKTYTLTYTAPTDMTKANMTAIFDVSGEKVPALMCHVYIYSNTYAVKTTNPDGAVVPYEKGLTCTTPGITEYFCVNDKASIDANKNGAPVVAQHALSGQATTKALGHQWGAWKEMYAPIPGVENSGWWHRKCEREYIADIHTGAKAKCTDSEDNHGNQFPCDAHVPAFVVVTPATCDAAGVQKKICSVCNVELPLEGDETAEIPQLKHVWNAASEWTVKTEPTCDKEGVALKQCTLCGKYVEDAVAALGHKLEEVAETPATCAATGLKAAFKCSVCGKLFSDEEGKTEITAQEVIPATGKHTWNDGEVVTAATCTKEGKKLITCTVCGLTKTEAIEKIAHTPVEVAEVPATCKDTGVKAGKKCSVCGEELEGFEVIPADETAHVWEEEVLVEATCEKAGTALKTCSVCGKVEKVEIEKLAHTWDEGKITKEATKEAKGEKTYTCTACGETKTEEVEYVVTAAPKYSVTGLTYDGQTLKGKLAHDEDTLEAETLNVRVTFFMTGNYYMATIGEVTADGSFSVDGVGPIEYISVVATGSSSVNPDDVVALGSGEITVK